MPRENETALERVRDAAAHLIVSAEIEMNDRTQLVALAPGAKIGKSLNAPGTFAFARVVTIDSSEHVKEYLAGARATVQRVRWLTVATARCKRTVRATRYGDRFASRRIGTRGTSSFRRRSGRTG